MEEAALRQERTVLDQGIATDGINSTEVEIPGGLRLYVVEPGSVDSVDEESEAASRRKREWDIDYLNIVHEAPGAVLEGGRLEHHPLSRRVVGQHGSQDSAIGGVGGGGMPETQNDALGLLIDDGGEPMVGAGILQVEHQPHFAGHKVDCSLDGVLVVERISGANQGIGP